MVGALDPPSVFIANLFENVVRRKEIAASAVANFFLLKLTNDASFYTLQVRYFIHRLSTMYIYLGYVMPL